MVVFFTGVEVIININQTQIEVLRTHRKKQEWLVTPNDILTSDSCKSNQLPRYLFQEIKYEVYKWLETFW